MEVSAQLESLAPQDGVKKGSHSNGVVVVDDDDDAVGDSADGNGGNGPDVSAVECCVCLDHPPTEPVRGRITACEQ